MPRVAIRRSRRTSTVSMPDEVILWKHQQRRRRTFILGGRIAVVLGFVAAWQFLTSEGGTGFSLFDSYYVSRPSDVAGVLAEWTSSGELWRNLVFTLRSMMLGLAIGVGAGLVTGFILGANEKLNQVLSPFLIGAYAIPRLALVPLFVLWFGIGTLSKVAFVAMIVFFLVFFNTYNGVREVNKSLIDIVHVMGATKAQTRLKVVLPSAMTWIIAGLQIAVPYALVGAVTAEIVSSNMGLGYLLTRSVNQFYIEGVFASITAMFVVALAVNQIVSYLDGRLLKWKRGNATDDVGGGALL